MADFEVDITRWVNKAKARTGAAPSAIAEAAKDRLQDLTPVVTGNLRAGWQVEQTSPNVWTIANNVEYARRVNSGFTGQDALGRLFDQQGHHMVEQVIAEMPQIAAKVVDKL